MNFCKFSTEIITSKHTMVDNLFITNFLPSAPEMAVKVYLYGLHKCCSPQSIENSLSHFSQVFGISEDDISSIFLYWQDLGLVQVLSTEPFEVRYMPLKQSSHSTKKWNDSKYATFNIQIQEVISGRMLTPNEYNEYYTLIESLKIEPDALVLIAKYCTDLKGETVGHAYITTVARIWAAEGIKTYEAVKEKLKSAEQTSISATKVLNALGSKRKANVEEQNIYVKWTESLGFSHETLINIAKMLKKQKKLSFNKMDYAVTNYYEAKMFSIKDIEEYENKKDEMANIAKSVNKSLGVWYDSLEAEISEFISKWLGLGFLPETLIKIASYCFKKSVRTLEGMDNIINKFYKLGIISLEALAEYIEDIANEDKSIKNILETLGTNREVNQWDRSLYKCWKKDWNFTDEIINFAVSLSANKVQPMQYVNKILSQWLEQKITTLEQAEKQSINFTSNITQQKSKTQKITPREYTSAELNALFDNLEEIEI